MAIIFKTVVWLPSILVVIVLLHLHVGVEATADCEDTLAEGDEARAEAVILCSAQCLPSVRLRVVHRSLTPIGGLKTLLLLGCLLYKGSSYSCDKNKDKELGCKCHQFYLLSY